MVNGGGTVAVGFFDGVHAGHREILRGADVAMTFRRHPLAVLAPGREPPLLMDFESRLAALRDTGVREIVALDFDADFAALSPEDFISRHLAGFASVRCGANWRFGAGGRGDAALLAAAGKSVTVVPYSDYGGETVSSTRIRAAVGEGRVADAAAMLGRPWEFRGRVRRGKGLGAEFGFPTVNLAPPDGGTYALPPHGVYAVRMLGADAVANWGVAPTMRDAAWPEPVLEVHLLGPVRDRTFPAEGDAVPVAFAARLRDERAFGSTDELCRQIAADCDRARRIFADAKEDRRA